MKVNIIIPFYKKHDTIDRLLDSLNDQDYEHFDVCIVIDGKDEKFRKRIITDIKSKKYRFNLYCEMPWKTNKGASAARNFGAKIMGMQLVNDKGVIASDTAQLVNGDNILFFIDADCQVYPGMLRECIEQLDDNPEIDFVYGNYRFNNQSEFYSQGFDPYLLQTMNYICTMSPVRRLAFKQVGGFIEDQEYFQDWSLFYRLARAGFEGKFINEFIFTTQEPKEDSISSIKGSLAEKATKFRKEHGIKDKKLVVTTHAAPLQAIQRAKMLNADYVGLAKDSRHARFPVNLGFKNWEYTYFVGCFNHPIEALENHMNMIWGHPIYHFIGTDVFQIYNKHPLSVLRGFAKAFKDQGAILLGNSPRCVGELKDCGFDAKLVYTPVYNMNQYRNIKSLPEKFTVGVYFSDTNPMHMRNGANQHSNIPLIEDVARSMPDVEFKFFGGNVKDKRDNIELVGRIPEEKMNEFINSCSMVVRSTIHDGFPQIPIQFMLAGRQALVSVPDKELKFADKLSFEDVLNWEDAKNEMIDKIYEMEGKQLSCIIKNKKIRSYYGRLMSPERYKKKINRIIMWDKIKRWFKR